MATRKQIEANRRNAKKGGPRTEKGKAVSRLNARKHGIVASALTEQDEEELHELYAEMAEWVRPVGPIEKVLVEMLAHTYLRLQRCARAEAEYHIETWEPKLDEYSVQKYAQKVRRGEHASDFDHQTFRHAVELFARYNKTLTNQLIKLLHEIERLQRLRLGDDVPAPVVADVTLHLDQEQAEEEVAEVPAEVTEAS